MHLSKRLNTLVHAVTPGHRVADIGCDHAFTAIALVEEGISPHVIASDINKGPLLRAKENIDSHGLGAAIETRLGSGLETVSPDEVDTVICAGMGGALMEQILLAAPDFFETGRELILSPHLEWYKIRRLLKTRSYRIVKEWFIKEDGKYYVVIKAGKDPDPSGGEMGGQSPSAPGSSEVLYDFYGRYLLEGGNPVLCEFLEKKKEKELNLLELLKSRDNQSGLKKRIRELEKELLLTGQALELINTSKCRAPACCRDRLPQDWQRCH